MYQPLITMRVTPARSDGSGAGLNTEKTHNKFVMAPVDVGDRSWTAERCFARPDDQAGPALKQVRTSGPYDRLHDRRRRALLAAGTSLKLDRRSAEAATMSQVGQPTDIAEGISD